MDRAGTIIDGDLLVVDGVIIAMGAAVPAALARLPGKTPEQTYDATGTFVLPGLVQGHIHLCQTLFRGLAEQADLLTWLRESIWPLEAAHTEASIAASVRLGLVELLRSGVTCVNDMGTVHHTEVIGEVLEQSGVRAIFGKALMDQGDQVPKALCESTDRALEEGRAVARRFDGAAGGRLRVSLAPRFILSCSETLWRGVAAIAREDNLLIHTHLAEHRGEAREVEAVVHATAARYFAGQGLLSDRFVAAHGVWLERDELALLKSADSALVHCPGSNLKLGSGVANVGGWKEIGLRCGLGSDGAACNNRLDPFHEMSLAAGLSRALYPEQRISPHDVLTLATRGGAEALGLGTLTGSLEVGKQADVIVVDRSAPHHAPVAALDPYVTIVESSRHDDVRLTMVGGRILYRDGEWATLNPERVNADAIAEAQGLLRRVSSS